MKRLAAGLFITALILTGCTFSNSEEGLRPRTAEENLNIQNQWYPVKSKDCQLLVDSFNLIRAAIGSVEMGYLDENLELINSRLELSGRVTSQKILELATTATEPSIREYALEAAPIFAQVGFMIVNDDSDFDKQLKFLEDFSKISGKVPDACKS